MSATTMDATVRLREGSECPNCRSGSLDVATGSNCSCHMHAPCYSCETTGLLCPVCGWRMGDDIDETEPAP